MGSHSLRFKFGVLPSIAFDFDYQVEWIVLAVTIIKLDDKVKDIDASILSLSGPFLIELFSVRSIRLDFLTNIYELGLHFPHLFENGSSTDRPLRLVHSASCSLLSEQTLI